MAETTTTTNNAEDLNIEKIALQIKSLEQRTTSVTLPRTATVLELKHEIQSAFDVESNRQRLIFQGRVLKDDKNLTDYANLDNGKVIHLVIRPADAPHNPSNDDPTPGQTRFGQRNGPRSFPSFMRGLPMMEGYAFITLDSTFGDISDGPSLLSTLLNGISPNRQRMTTPVSSNNNSNPSSRASSNTSTQSNATSATTSSSENNSSTTTSSIQSGLFQRRPFSFNFGHRAEPTSPTGTNNSSSNPFSLFNSSLSDRLSSSVSFPSSVEVRLVRTLGSIRNVRAMLEDPSIMQDTTSPSTIHHSSAEQLAEIRSRLRESGSTQSAQIGMVLGELADLMTDVGPRLRDIATSLRQGNLNSENTTNTTSSGERSTSGRVNNMSRIVQGMSLINHFLGSILASADNETRRNNTSSAATTTTPATTSPNTRSSANTRNSTPLTTSISNSSSSGSSGSGSGSDVTANTDKSTSSSKRKAEAKEEEKEDSAKRMKDNKGKGKKKTD